jgi:hypothetical protein
MNRRRHHKAIVRGDQLIPVLHTTYTPREHLRSRGQTGHPSPSAAAFSTGIGVAVLRGPLVGIGVKVGVAIVPGFTSLV